MIRTLSLVLVVAALISGTPVTFAQSTAFTYQGRLTDNGNPANGNYDLRFVLYEAPADGNAVGGPLTNAPVLVSNGLFTVVLDFGPDVFTGASRWLEIAVRTNGNGTFSPLAPRQQLSATPYAITAATLGAIGNLPVEFKVNGLRALRLEPAGDSAIHPDGAADGAPNVIGGAPNNMVAAGVAGATISGGGATNHAGSARPNTIAADYATIGGGSANTIQPFAGWATISGGDGNRIQLDGAYGTIAGGGGNTIQTRAEFATISGGNQNTILLEGRYATISGGGGNTIQNLANAATIGGGLQNTIEANASSATIGGGNVNIIEHDAYNATISGGLANTIQVNAYDAAIGGGEGNRIQAGAAYATISGGRINTVQTNASSATIGGGFQNTIQMGAEAATIGGGGGNVIQIAAGATIIGGGSGNRIETGSHGATIAGGGGNVIHSNSFGSAIGGGLANAIHGAANSLVGLQCTIAGGGGNTIQAGSYNATIGGGGGNTIQRNSLRSTIGGGFGNTIHDNAWHATIPGGRSNSATNDAFAAGTRAQAIHTGAFVWGDSNNSDILSTRANSVTMRASGGYRLLSGINPTAGVLLEPGSGSWTSMSDRNVKENFKPIDARAVLDKVSALPVGTWNFKTQTNGVRHIGPMAQDFKAAFGVGESDIGITTIDADGVALAAIQGLNEKLEEKNAEIRELKRRLTTLEKIIAAMSHQ